MKRIASRFLFLYFALFLLTIPFSGLADTRLRWWLCLGSAAVALLAVVASLALGWGRDQDARLDSWLRLLLRFTLAIVMISSGIERLIPVQMPAPGPFDLLRQLGELSAMGLLWTFLGASKPFQSFTGAAGLAGGLLLLAPRTTLLGALICGANLLMAVAVSLCYDLPFKLYFFHLLLMAVLLIVPDLRRLGRLILLNRPVEPAAEPPLSARSRRAQTLLVVISLIVIGWSLQDAVRRYRRLNPPRPPLYGVWTVEGAGMDPWRWVVFQDPGALDAVLKTGERQRHALDLDLKKKTMILDHQLALKLSEPEADVLVLDGLPMPVKLRRMRLTTPWFHWILRLEMYE
ncbi:MAG TPA: hypothetical protein VGP73_01910 [Thermoanaerobaculia bacterium]